MNTLHIDEMMERMRIESSDLKSVGYDESTQTLEIEFRQGGVYQYFGVPKKIHDGLMQYALSHDQYHNRFIKNRYRHKKIR
ncbi:KTSC domain-containing protein [Candidatus Nitrosotenuis chungbukensis]|nr:KTSC domain-containing protein [Candidatus Nitrosotenuis chungbukensis]